MFCKPDTVAVTKVYLFYISQSANLLKPPVVKENKNLPKSEVRNSLTNSKRLLHQVAYVQNTALEFSYLKNNQSIIRYHISNPTFNTYSYVTNKLYLSRSRTLRIPVSFIRNNLFAGGSRPASFVVQVAGTLNLLALQVKFFVCISKYRPKPCADQ